MLRTAHRLVALFIAYALIATPAQAIEALEKGSVANLPPVSEHWVWVPDVLLAHSFLFDGDSGELLATVDGGATLSPKPPFFSPERGEFYSVEIDYSRGRRGKRIDYVTIYDAVTLAATDEILLPTRTSESASSVAYAALLDGGRFLATFNQFPNASVTVVDLPARQVVDEIVITGCAGIYPTGERSFATLCGNGTALALPLDAAGRKRDMTVSQPFFDVVSDPVMMAGGRRGERWTFVSFEGVAHEVDFGKATPTASAWPLASEAEREAGWRPGGRQSVALHAASGRLFVVFHQGGSGTHKDPGPEIWAFDLAEHERVARFGLPNFTAAFLAGNTGMELVGFTGWLLTTLLPDEGADIITVSQDDAPLLFARNSNRGAVAVLDARTGEHLRFLMEAGLGGMRLETVR
jgi:methylamine dehydrogenase heavy chain